MDRVVVWLPNTGEDANAWMSNFWPMGDQPAPLLTLLGAPILLAHEFKQLGVRIHLDAEHGTGPVP